MTRRLLLVEPSATMRHVLEKHVRALGHEIEATDSYSDALDALQRQYRAFESDFAGVLYGWPSLQDERAATLAARLESDDLADLPVVVMSTDMRAETRAWVAGRERTAVLAWKHYLGIDALLERLLDGTADAPGEQVAKFDNTDIHVLVVDDSLTIRYSLRDLFELQGYRVSIAANRDEALAAARATRFDVAVLDFYLEETTGDALCRDLVSDPACGDVVCAILTGTYADHVIKRSLRAGAVECMFKNESSELLLTRIDAIARFVRQRRELAIGLGRLERVVDTLGGAVFVVDAEGRVRHASAAALAELGLGDPDSVVGQPERALLGVERLPIVGERPESMTWHDATGQALSVSVSRLALPGGEESLLRFERLADEGLAGEPLSSSHLASVEGTSDVRMPDPVGADDAVPDHPSPDPTESDPTELDPTEPDRAASGHAASRGDTDRVREAMLARLGLPASALPFVEQLEHQVLAVGTRPYGVSLLLLGVHERHDDGAHHPVGDALVHRVEAGLGRLYRRAHHVAALGEHRFGLLIRHRDAAQSYLLTRRLMQLCDTMLVADGGSALACAGCLAGLDGHPGRSTELLLGHARRGLDIVERRGVDQALLLDLRRILAVYPGPPADVPATVGGTGSDNTTPSEPGAEGTSSPCT